MISQLENNLLGLAVVLYLVAMVLYFVYTIQRREKTGPAFWVTALAFAIQTAAMIVRTACAGRLPFSNMYEFTSLFAWGIALVFLFIERRYAVKALGAFITPLIFVLIGYASVLPKEITPLMPALQSYWLQIHVITAILAYGGFGVSFGVAVMYLIREKKEASGKAPGGVAQLLPGLKVLDDLNYGAIAFAFPFMTLVLITGAIWAERAWGAYWSWDPKEVWALITWIIYAVYLHARYTYGWKGHRVAWMSITGFLAVLFTYFGVNLLLSGLHSYV
ncbi:c-type cytochrome biogenesis protein CcsB [Desulfoscipio gibsoniae]|uniref:Cytochrome c-type biogenesis protein CcsB n=1 Tax=Desulfoscipio gibsoniae DSM 7213 TaxID=767817 RepID=R4KIC1_9FIRM|nr:c-type cytochrome biogenesis protein CcsB [Desulfoscipio gibsoniae]AGL02364.1 cytochrome c-type biogenesis protein CcsB [Desulfoscipio gibsoniae DSM 7213]